MGYTMEQRRALKNQRDREFREMRDKVVDKIKDTGIVEKVVDIVKDNLPELPTEKIQDVLDGDIRDVTDELIQEHIRPKTKRWGRVALDLITGRYPLKVWLRRGIILGVRRWLK